MREGEQEMYVGEGDGEGGRQDKEMKEMQVGEVDGGRGEVGERDGWGGEVGEGIVEVSKEMELNKWVHQQKILFDSTGNAGLFG